MSVFDQLLGKDVECYQDIWVQGRVLNKGIRDSAKRYQIMKKHIPDGSVVMDIGSCYGYFGARLAKEKDCLIWSFEPDSVRTDIQTAMIIGNDLRSMYLSDRTVDMPLLDSLYSVVETIDVVLAMSVAHYWQPEKTYSMVKRLSQIAPKLIIEVAQENERIVANKDDIGRQNIMKALTDCYETIDLIGEVASSKDPDVKRPIYLCQNPTVSREAYGYINGSNGKKHRLYWTEEMGWSVDGKEVYRGLNVHNVLQVGLAYPYKDYLIDKAVEAYYQLKKTEAVTDVRLWNCIVHTGGVSVIDYQDDNFVSPSGESVDAYVKRIKHSTMAEIKKELTLY